MLLTLRIEDQCTLRVEERTSSFFILQYSNERFIEKRFILFGYLIL